MSIKVDVPQHEWDAMTETERDAHRTRVRNARRTARAAKGMRPHDPVEAASHRDAVRHARLTGLVL